MPVRSAAFGRATDKTAAIDFIAPGREDVFTEFMLDAAVLDELRAATAHGGKYLRWFEVDIRTAGGELVARYRKQLHVRRKTGGSRPPRFARRR